MHHRLGKPLPYQLANAPQVHPRVIAKAIFQAKAMWLLLLCGISICFQMLSPAPGQVTYVLLTRPPLTGDPSVNQVQAPSISWASAYDLHVLGTPPAFILSQDQTLI